MSKSELPRFERPSRTKIVATVGPACEGVERLKYLIAAGVDVFRLNMAHGDRAQHERHLGEIREASRAAGWPVGILIDLAGPKIRLGELPGGEFDCLIGEKVRIVSKSKYGRPGDLTTNYEPLVDELSVGDRVMLADGTVALVVERKGDHCADCRVTQSGLIRSRQGVNLPGTLLSIPTLGDADRDNASWAAKNGIDFVGLSFVRSADDVRQLKELLASDGLTAQVIAKIEKPQAVEHLNEIVKAADGVMVARGDLGVEIDVARTAVVQKEIIATCSRLRKPVITATQMLDSMQHSRIPTRAEVTDVANAILDGADACMLSGETAIGKYPLEAVKMMHRIAIQTEPIYHHRKSFSRPNIKTEAANAITEAMVDAAGQIADRLDAKMLVVGSSTGATALSVAKCRNRVYTIGVSDSEAVLRRICLYWGVVPFADAPADGNDAVLKKVIQWGREGGVLDDGDRIVMVVGDASDSVRNTVTVHEVR